MTISYEKKMEELKTIVAKLEDGSAPLDEMIELYERGVSLVKECETILEEAEMKVSLLQDG
ncbi:exonuclease VII small subunit [Methanomicrobiaceae archaeon CYW5]|uniref:exodeoxyribonuclease VII small subunit n=1 Tax=Methanovulcanius yangii TaxID=1789227 RepID=UPI0029C9F65E|nr:exodeoxyribonuclease VII small subunit [Methanovulcanius yangii]MBT8507139.1 exonuclease VII small subunit [Methanovulcanius yangii]